MLIHRSYTSMQGADNVIFSLQYMHYQLLSIMLHNMNHRLCYKLVNEYNLSVYNALHVIVAISDLIVYISSRIDTNSTTF